MFLSTTKALQCLKPCVYSRTCITSSIYKGFPCSSYGPMIKNYEPAHYGCFYHTLTKNGNRTQIYCEEKRLTKKLNLTLLESNKTICPVFIEYPNSFSSTSNNPKSNPIDDEESPKKQQIIVNIKTKKTGEENLVENEEVTSPSLYQRFKDAYKQYGKVLVGVHLATSTVWFGCFFYVAKSGLDVVPILESIGASETLIKPFKSGAGDVAVAYVLYKLATPLRYAVTIGGTKVTVNRLQYMGYMKRPAPEDSIKNLMKDGRIKMKDKLEDMKDDMKEEGKKMKDKLDDIKYDMSDNMVKKKTQIKGKVVNFKDKIKKT